MVKNKQAQNICTEKYSKPLSVFGVSSQRFLLVDEIPNKLNIDH